MPSRQISITNTALRNGGDAAIVEAMTLTLSKAFDGAEFSYDDNSPESTALRFPNWDIGPYRVRSGRPIGNGLARQISSAGMMVMSALAARFRTRNRGPVPDLVVSAGGTYLNNKYLALDKLGNIWLAQKEGSSTVIFTQTVSKLDRKIERRLARIVFEAADLVLLRDEASLANLEAMGIDCRNVWVVADAVFALAELDMWARPRRAGLHEVGISVRDCGLFHDDENGETDYRSSVAALCTDIVRKHNARVRFISTCQGVDGYHFDDSQVADSIVELLDSDIRGQVLVDHGFHTPAEFRSILSDIDLLVSTRMHGAIQALAVGTPVIPIAYESKTTSLWASFGLEDACVDLGRSSDDLGPIFERTVRDLSSYTESLAAGTARAHESANCVVELVRNAVR